MITAPEQLIQIVDQNPTISKINLFRPIMSPPIQHNSNFSAPESKLIDGALDLRKSTSLPFWDCLLQLISNSSDEAPTLLKMAQRHNPQCLSLEQLARENVRKDILEAKIKELQPGAVLAISSKVECADDSIMHLPMLDFHCRTSSKNDKLVKSIVGSLGLHGYIAHSGQSYHFYGSELVDGQTLSAMLAKALLYAPVVDRAWLAHQLIEGACGLRISPGKNYLHCPAIIDQI